MVILNCVMRSTPAVSLAQGSWLLDASSSREVTTFRTSIPLWPDAILEQEFLLIDGTDRARQAVRQNEFQNVDVIKVAADENLTVPELGAVIEEAHRKHLKVAVHAVHKTSIQISIDAGADSIEHGNEATDAQLKQMHDKGSFST